MSAGVKLDSLALDVVPVGARLRPLRDTIVVKVIEFGYSDIIEETYRGKPVKGEVIAVGPGSYPYQHERGDKDGERYHSVRESLRFRPTEVRVGQIVHLGGLENQGYSFQQVLIDGAKHVICSEKDVAGVENA